MNKICIQITVFLILLLLTGVIYAQDSVKVETKKSQNFSNKEGMAIDPSNLEITGLVIDRTRSKIGKDFVDIFNKSWNPPKNIPGYTITIEEKPLPQFGTMILIKINDSYIYQKFIKPRYETIKKDALQGTEFALQYLVNYQRIQKDLQGEDLKGTGIF